MADFGEYLPTDAVLYDGDAREFHNTYPAEWARANYEAMVEATALADTAIFMRAGFTGSSRYTHSIWAGDQMVDWSRHDGLPSVIPAALSAGFCGIGVHHSDTGGYTTLFHKKRGKELFQRWAEQSAFTPIMRTHEGNRPASNWQWDSDEETMAHLARMAQIYAALRPYRRAVLEEYQSTGLPAQRPVFLHYPQWFDVPMRMQQYTYLFGRDLFVAPVLKKGVRTARTVVPPGRWVHLWTEREFDFTKPTQVRIAAPLGEPPVFFRAESEWRELFISITRRTI
jgi:alpha-glucosidase